MPSYRRSGDDVTWAERYALGLFVAITPFSYALCGDRADAVNAIVIVNTAVALAAWGVFRALACVCARRPFRCRSRSPSGVADASRRRASAFRALDPVGNPVVGVGQAQDRALRVRAHGRGEGPQLFGLVS